MFRSKLYRRAVRWLTLSSSAGVLMCDATCAVCVPIREFVHESGSAERGVAVIVALVVAAFVAGD
ncbi:MAG: hypothetical protein HY763_04800 [Planctomycetes bacterium]|nr:hypothetical protein [Planctomycetota bacterium]